MKRLLILPALIALASCAPAVQVDPSYSAARTYSGTCAQALPQLNTVAIRTRPAVLLGTSSWTPLRQTSSTPTSAAYISTTGSAVITYGIVQSINSTVTVTASCVDTEGRATVTLASSGQRRDFIDALNKSLLAGVTLL